MGVPKSLVDGAKAVDVVFVSILRVMVVAMAACSGLAVLTMMTVTTTDVVMRVMGSSLTGAYDIVRMAGVVAIACALPYTTAVKGHVAIEYFFHKLHRPGRVAVDTINRLLIMAFLVVIARQTLIYGNTLKRTGEVSLTLQLPVYWIAYFISGALAVTVLVKAHNLLHPGRGMIKP